MLIVRVTRSVAIGDVSIGVVPVGLAGKDSFGPKLVRTGNKNSDKNDTYIDRWPACKENFTLFGYHRQTQSSFHHTPSHLIKRLPVLHGRPTIEPRGCRH